MRDYLKTYKHNYHKTAKKKNNNTESMKLQKKTVILADGSF